MTVGRYRNLVFGLCFLAGAGVAQSALGEGTTAPKVLTAVKLKVLPVPAPEVFQSYKVRTIAAGAGKIVANNVTQTNEAGWTNEGGKSTVAPAIVATGADRMSLAVFAQGTDKQLWWHKVGEASNSWTGLGGAISSAPSCISRFIGGKDRIDCFARGMDFALWRITIVNGVAGSWKSLGGQLLSGPSAVAVGDKNDPYFGPLKMAGSVGVVALGLDGGLWGLQGNPSQIVGGDYAWGGWTAVVGTGPEKLKYGAACLAINYWGDWSDVVCQVPVGSGLADIRPFITVGKEGNHYMTTQAVSTPSVPAYAYPQSILVFQTNTGGVSLAANFSVSNKSPQFNDLGLAPKSGPSCVLIGAAGPQPQFGCAAIGPGGAVWVRKLQLVH